MSNCAICKCELTNENISRWNIPDTNKHNTIRKDSMGRDWCKECTEKFDDIEWDN